MVHFAKGVLRIGDSKLGKPLSGAPAPARCSVCELFKLLGIREKNPAMMGVGKWNPWGSGSGTDDPLMVVKIDLVREP